jgi:predicted enzyme related to lactoylglutathione lyase
VHGITGGLDREVRRLSFSNVHQPIKGRLMRKIIIPIGIVLLLVAGASTLRAAEGWLASVEDVGFVTKINVKSLDASTKWYVEKVGLIPDPTFDTPSWRQLYLPKHKDIQIGLNLNPKGVGTGGATLTFVVQDIEKERQALIKKGVTVSKVTDVGHGVLLAFFKDPDGNQLGLRQNGPKAAAK